MKDVKKANIDQYYSVDKDKVNQRAKGADKVSKPKDIVKTPQVVQKPKVS